MFDHDVSGEFVDTIPAACVADSGSAALSQVKWLQPHVVLVDFSDAGTKDGVAIVVHQAVEPCNQGGAVRTSFVLEVFNGRKL